MLNINIELKKGVMLIKLKGLITINNYNKLLDIKRIITKYNINDVVLDLKDLKIISKYKLII